MNMSPNIDELPLKDVSLPTLMMIIFVTPPDPLGLTRHPTCHPQTGCVRSAAQYTPTHHPSPSIHTGWVVASGNRTPNLTFNTSGSPADEVHVVSCLGFIKELS